MSARRSGRSRFARPTPWSSRRCAAGLATRSAVVRVYAEDIVTGEIIAPVKRRRLVRYVETFSEHRYGRWVLAAIAFADSSFLPLPPDLLLVPMALVRPKQVWALSLICTVASSLGAVVGYLIGYGFGRLSGP